MLFWREVGVVKYKEKLPDFVFIAVNDDSEVNDSDFISLLETAWQTL